MIKHYDVVIIGAGPAGATLARMTRDQTVALIDRRPLGREYIRGDFMKSCGGLLSPRSQKFLKQNSISIPKNVYMTDQYDRVLTTDFDAKITRQYSRNYINIDREKFDRFMASDLPGVDKYFDFDVNNLEYKNGKFIINGMISADVLVGADGAGSLVRRTFFPSIKFKEYVSIQEVYDKKHVSEYECYFDVNTGDYYGWALNKNNKTQMGFLINANAGAAEKFQAFKLKRNFGSPESVQGALLIRPSYFHPITCTQNIFLIGEAGGYVSPSSAEGISFAMRTAKILAVADYDHKKFRRKMRRVQIEIFIKKLKSLVIYTPWIRFLVMRFLPVGKLKS